MMRTKKGPSYREVKSLAKDYGVVVKVVSPSRLKDYAGMNSRAARSLGFRMPKRTIYICSSLNPKDRLSTLRHELNEYMEMGKGKSYWTAHLESLELEGKGCLKCLVD